MAGTRNPIVVKSGSGTCRTTAPPMETGQTVSQLTGDDGDTERGRGSGFFHCMIADKVYELYGHTFRFTGLTGGYCDNTDGLYYDKDGVETFEALAFPDGIIIDWSTFKEIDGSVLMYCNETVSNSGNMQQLITAVRAITIGAFSDWETPNICEAIKILNFDFGKRLNYAPFNISLNISTCTFSDKVVGRIYYIRAPTSTGACVEETATTASYTRITIPIRVGNISEL